MNQKEAQTKASTVVQEDHFNHSTITTVSAPEDVTTTPQTSPVAMHLRPQAKGVSSQTSKRFDKALEVNREAIVSILRELCASASENVDLGAHFDWKTILETSESIFNEYSKTMEDITQEFEGLNRDFLIWQESAYILDSEQVSQRLSSQETWIGWKESFLKYTDEELLKSAGLIDDAIKKLKRDR